MKPRTASFSVTLMAKGHTTNQTKNAAARSKRNGKAKADRTKMMPILPAAPLSQTFVHQFVNSLIRAPARSSGLGEADAGAVNEFLAR